MNNEKKASEKRIMANSIAIDVTAIALLLLVINVAKDWVLKTANYSYKEAVTLVFFSGLVCYGFSILLIHLMGRSEREGEKITKWEISAVGIPLGVGIFSYLLGYWGFGHSIFPSGTIVLLVIVAASYMLGKNQNQSALKKTEMEADMVEKMYEEIKQVLPNIKPEDEIYYIKASAGHLRLSTDSKGKIYIVGNLDGPTMIGLAKKLAAMVEKNLGISIAVDSYKEGL